MAFEKECARNRKGFIGYLSIFIEYFHPYGIGYSIFNYLLNLCANRFQIQSRASQRKSQAGVDESLFGGQSGTQKKGSKFPGGVQTSTGFITIDELRTIRGKTEKNNQNDAVILSKNDLDRIKDATTIKTKDQLLQEKKLADQ